MPFTLILHIQNSEPVVGEVEEMPSPTDHLVAIQNPRRKDGKDLTNISENAITIIFPVERLNFIEIISGEQDEEIIGFVRE